MALAIVLFLSLALPPNALLCSLPFYTHNDIYASTSAVLSIKNLKLLFQVRLVETIRLVGLCP